MQNTYLERPALPNDTVHRPADKRDADHHTTDQRSDAIEQSIAQTLAELDADDSGLFDCGAEPLDGSEVTPRPTGPIDGPPATPPRPRSRNSQSDAHISHILAAMLASALVALGLLGFAFAEGYIP